MRNLVLMLIALAGIFAGTQLAKASRPATAVGVAEREFHLSTYRTKVKPGAVTFYVSNLGQDTHDLAVTGPHGFAPPGTGDIRAGDRAKVTLNLKRPGTYVLLCTRANHAALGMRTKLVVKR